MGKASESRETDWKVEALLGSDARSKVQEGNASGEARNMVEVLKL